jgi:hypothetical protein
MVYVRATVPQATCGMPSCQKKDMLMHTVPPSPPGPDRLSRRQLLRLGALAVATTCLPCPALALERTSQKEGVSDVLILHQMDIPNSYRLIKRPITKSCMRSVLEKQIVRRTNRLIRVRMLMCLLSIFWVCAFPTVCCSAATCRS